MISAAGTKDQELAVERLGGGLVSAVPALRSSGAMNELFAMESTSCPASCVGATQDDGGWITEQCRRN
jgi:hypothetical protein